MPDASVLLDLLSKRPSIQQLVDFAAESLGNPLLVCDSRFRILFMSKEDNLSVPLWQRARLEGYVSDAVLTDMKRENTLEKLQSTDAPVEAISGVRLRDDDALQQILAVSKLFLS